MAVLLDTSILGRIADKGDPDRRAAQEAILKLHGRGEILLVTAQNLIEFRNFATRPTKVNCLGLSVSDASQLTATFEASFPLLPETPDIYPAWRAIVDGLGVVGKTVHDARLVAVCHVHSVSGILTFNVSHFTTLAGFGKGVTVLDPRSI